MTLSNSAEALIVAVTIDWALDSDTAMVTEERAEGLLHHALHREGQTGSWELAIRFVDDQEMIRLHELYLKEPTPTDIMTFPYDPEDGQGGDVVISVDTAARNALEANWELPDELEFLMLHGLLHILGGDDHSDGARAAMLEHQHVLLASWTGIRQMS